MIPSQEERLRRWMDTWGHKCYHEWEKIMSPTEGLYGPLRRTFKDLTIGRRCLKCGEQEIFK